MLEDHPFVAIEEEGEGEQQQQPPRYDYIAIEICMKWGASSSIIYASIHA